MESRQEKYFKNYRYDEIPTDNSKGFRRIWTYTGDYYTWDISAIQRKRLCFFYLIAEVISIGCFTAASFLGTHVNISAFVAIPALFNLIALIFELIAIAGFCFKKMPYEESVFNYIEHTLSFTFPFRFICLLASAISGGILCAATICSPFDFLSAAAYLFAAVPVLPLLRSFRKLRSVRRVILSEYH